MVRIHDESDHNKNKKDDAITKRTFLASLKTYYKADGVQCQVESISHVFPNSLNNNKPSVFVTLIIGEMPRCKARNIDDEGKAIKIQNELGEMVDEIVEIDATDETVSMSFNLKYSEDDEDGTLFTVHPMASFYPLLNAGLKDKDMIPEDNSQAFDIEYEEILEALEEFNFIAKAERINPKNNSFVPFDKLIVEVE